jgi:hypothetical protein
MKKCGACGKVSYASKALAASLCLRIAKFGKCNPYYCEEGRAWHITNPLVGPRPGKRSRSEAKSRRALRREEEVQDD